MHEYRCAADDELDDLDYEDDQVDLESDIGDYGVDDEDDEHEGHRSPSPVEPAKAKPPVVRPQPVAATPAADPEGLARAVRSTDRIESCCPTAASRRRP